ncbi:TTAGGG repeat binding factor [Teratosphaeriaceae sp. CCFEE 6253]|nr:TTAGGG repeat binding factor [Teratosphaeriaceae sp. CCFEE 6253]
MAKRRRLEEADPSWEGAQQQPHEPYVHPVQHGAFYGGAVGAADSSSELPPAPSSSQVWSSGASTYPDVASYSQPYFYQATDPLTYTSPWPPVHGTTFNNTAGYNTDIGASADMPFFPTNPTNEQPGVYDASAIGSYPNYSQSDVNTQYAYADQVRPDAIASTAGSAFYLDDASMHLKLQSLPILDNLATQLIHTIAKANYPQIQDLMRGNDNEEAQAYMTLKSLFDQTRKVYSRETPFIDAIAIQMFQPAQQELIRKANIATFVSSILGAHDVSFFHLNEYFMETFVPSGHRLLKWQGAIYLELKTQTYISAIMNSDGSPQAMLDELFPPDLDALILTRHPDAPSLSPSEQDFLDRCRARKSYLLAEPSTDEAVAELPKKYQWGDFVREFASCISKNVDGIMNAPVRSQATVGGGGDKKGANTAHGVQDTLAGSAKDLAGQSVPPPTHQASSGEKKSSAPSSTIRQPWTKPEEDALVSGLEKVNGPHWSQILALYGRGGSVSEVLKDRNQVQLKDKARNLKLWYLKMGKEVPMALRGVTGELRKRGGARARAALGILDEEQDAEDAEGESLDPDLGQQRQERRPSKKKKSKK